ncbi:probable mitogen-activated protein kinase kinase kinase 7 at C-terminar half [Coccomyxa sp. Obi]|nr:probable mitogen-activated protein kinase kinase kinase 7 at C-terminar half [Coccomyxa sp. Obi]
MYLRSVSFIKYVVLLSLLVAVSVNAASAVSETQGSAAEPFENLHGQPDTLTSIKGGLLAQPQGNATFTVISSPGAEPLAPKGGSSTVGILGGMPELGTFTGDASTIDHVTVNGQQCTPSLPAATDASTATAQVPALGPHAALLPVAPAPGAAFVELITPAPGPQLEVVPPAPLPGPPPLVAAAHAPAAPMPITTSVAGATPSTAGLDASAGPPAAALAELPPSATEGAPSMAPAGSPKDASFTSTAAAGLSASSPSTRQITIIAVAASTAIAALLAAVAMVRWCRSRRAVHSRDPATQTGSTHGRSQQQNGSSLADEQSRGSPSGPLSLPNLPIRFQPLQLRPTEQQDKPAVQRMGAALLPTHTSPSVTPTAARRAWPSITQLIASSTAAGEPPESFQKEEPARKQPPEEGRRPALAALQLGGELDGHLLQPTPLTRRWTWHEGSIISLLPDSPTRGSPWHPSSVPSLSSSTSTGSSSAHAQLLRPEDAFEEGDIQPKARRSFQPLLGYPSAPQALHDLDRHADGLHLPRAFSAPTPAFTDINFARDVVLEEKIGSGAFGTVYKARWRGRPVAVKVMVASHSENTTELESFRREVEVLSGLQHDRIVCLLGACLAPPTICIVEELALGGSLYDFLHTRDLKSSNVLLDNLGRAKDIRVNKECHCWNASIHGKSSEESSA